MEILQQVKAIASEISGVDASQIGDYQPLDHQEADGLDLDSLDRIDLALMLEEHFGIEIPDCDVDRLEPHCAAIAAYLSRRLLT